MILKNSDLPQADIPETLIALARHLYDSATYKMPPNCQEARTLSYYTHALRIIGALDQNGCKTDLLKELAGSSEQAKNAFIQGFSQSNIGQAWLAWEKKNSLLECDENKFRDFIEEKFLITNETLKRRAQTLKGWLRWCKDKPLEPKQMDLFGSLANEEIAPPLPAGERFPHNENEAKVRALLGSDLRDGDILIVTGYASLDEIVKLLAIRFEKASGKVRIILGNEPFTSTRLRTARHSIKDDVRDYWLERGISILYSADILQAIEMIQKQQVEIRIAGKRKDLHAKIYLGQTAATLGSSNFTFNGLGGQSEANVRFTTQEFERYQEIQSLAEHFWLTGEDFSKEFEDLLSRLLKAVTWEEALARGCAEILEGEWAQKYIPADEIAELQPPLWPHQYQGLSQALWTLHNLGSVLIADAAGSGKTRMGAWIIRALHDMQLRAGHEQRFHPVVITPPGVIANWEEAFREAHLFIQPNSHGVLSVSQSNKKRNLLNLIEATSLLAVDEAHNFINNSSRTQALMSHYADNVVLFTATPINKHASDLLGMIELLGADNFSEEARAILLKLNRQNSYQSNYHELQQIRKEIQRFLVRRTRWELNQLADKHVEAYQMSDGRQARYPDHKPSYYTLPLSPADAQIANAILALSNELTGIARIGKEILLPNKLAKQGMSEERYLQMILSAASALSKYTLLDCLRSSRVAAYEHIHGTAAAIAQLVPEKLDLKKDTGNMVASLVEKSGQIPLWKFKHLNKEDWPNWLWDEKAHQEICAKDADLFKQIAELVLSLSPEREEGKVKNLIELSEKKGQVIGFDSHVISLEIFSQMIEKKGLACESFTGAHGAQGKARAVDEMGKNSSQRQYIALCSDALSEGMNLQGASVVVHLDAPTVIRIAEQRAGRVDRMDSKHAEVEILWPDEKDAFLPLGKDPLRLRHEIVQSLIGANLEIPLDENENNEIIIHEQNMAEKANLNRKDVDLQGIFDAFRPVKILLEPDGLVSESTYEMIKNSQSRVVACVSAVKAKKPWAFFAVGGPQRIAPRWVFIEEAQIEPLTSLDEVSEALIQHLSEKPETHELNEQAKRVMQNLLKQLGKSQNALLPRRRQRALKLAEKVLLSWQKQAKAESDFDRSQLINELIRFLSPDPISGQSPDLRAIADSWLTLFRPYQQKLLEERKGKTNLWKLEDLEPELQKIPIPTAQLDKAFRSVPYLIPLSDRIVAAIIGVPESKGKYTVKDYFDVV